MSGTTTKGLVSFDLGSAGTEVWLVENPAEVEAAYRVGGLDDAAAVARGAVTLEAPWGSDVPATRDDAWLDRVADECGDPAAVRSLVESRWAE
jgi:hypothetical protein